jgi:glycosyltransferase involved in cell wall biosynthesis
MDVSIIIPHYNSSDKLFRLLESIPPITNIEIIVVDDKSNEEEIKKILFSKYYSRIKFYFNSGKKSAGSCRNMGIKYSTKKWILFADSDDYFLRDFFNVLKEYEQSYNDIIFFTPVSCYSDSKKNAGRHVEFKKLIDAYINKNSLENLEILKYKFIVPWSKLIKKSVILENNIYFDEVVASNDVMFSIKLGHISNNIGVSDKNIYCVTVNKGSLTLRLNEEIFNSRLSVNERKNSYFKKIGKEKFITSGLSFLILSRKFGFKKFLTVLKIIIKNRKYIFNGIKYWKNNIIEKILYKKYIIEEIE